MHSRCSKAEADEERRELHQHKCVALWSRKSGVECKPLLSAMNKLATKHGLDWTHTQKWKSETLNVGCFFCVFCVFVYVFFLFLFHFFFADRITPTCTYPIGFTKISSRERITVNVEGVHRHTGLYAQGCQQDATSNEDAKCPINTGKTMFHRGKS